MPLHLPGKIIGALGSADNPFAGKAERDAVMPAASQPERTRCWVLNPLCVDGMTEFVIKAGAWYVRPNQRVYCAFGTLLDITAAALSIGAWNEVWQSPILPDWIFQESPSISLSGLGELKAGASDVAMKKVRLLLRSGASASGDENDSFVGTSATGNSWQYGRGFGGVRIRGNVVGSSIIGTAGGDSKSASAQSYRAIGNWGIGQTRIRWDAWPGETTNTMKLFSVELFSGA